MVKKLYLLNGLAIIAVILNHASHWGVIMFAQKSGLTFAGVTAQNMGFFSYFSLYVVGRLGTFSVPAFLFVSGYFIQYAMSGTTTRISAARSLWRRILNLFIPYLIWSCVYFLLDFLLFQRQYPLQLYVWKLLSGKVLSEYYYVPVLFQLYFLALLVMPLMKKHAGWILAISISLMVLVHTLNYLKVFGVIDANALPVKFLTDWSFFLKWSGYFAFGIYIGLNKSALARFYPYRWLLLALVLVFHVCQVLEGEWLFNLAGDPNWRDNPMIFSNLFALTLIVWYLSAVESVPSPLRIIGKLSGYIYGIYLIHPILIPIMAQVFGPAIPGFADFIVINQLVLVAWGLGVPILLMTLVKRSSLNPAYKFMFG